MKSTKHIFVTRTILAIVAALSITSSTAYSNDKEYYGTDGSHKGYIDSSGGVYAADGTYAGEVESDGSKYDAYGNYAGQVESDGSVYDASGNYIGEVE